MPKNLGSLHRLGVQAGEDRRLGSRIFVIFITIFRELTHLRCVGIFCIIGKIADRQGRVNSELEGGAVPQCGGFVIIIFPSDGGWVYCWGVRIKEGGFYFITYLYTTPYPSKKKNSALSSNIK